VHKSGHCEVGQARTASAAKQSEPKGAPPWVCDELPPWYIAGAQARERASAVTANPNSPTG